MDNEPIDHPYIIANIKKYYKVLIKLNVPDQEFFRIIRLKNMNIENMKDHVEVEVSRNSSVKKEEMEDLEDQI